MSHADGSQKRDPEPDDGVRDPDGPMTAPRRTGEPRIEFACPNCRVRLMVYYSKCPSCGLPLADFYSGRYHLRRGPGTRVVSWVILVLFAICIVGAIAAIVANLMGR